jgi:hypothetical protein
MLLTALLACPQPGPDSDSTPDSTLTEATWQEAFDTSSSGSLSGVWGSAPDDVFVVGGSEGGAEVYHYDGSAWSGMDLPEDLPLLVWVHGFGPDDVWAVGVDGAAAHYDGSAWSAVETGTDQDLWGVWGPSSEELWVVGGDADVGEPLILHVQGGAWSEVALGEGENDRGATTLFKVFGLGQTAFIVGQHGLVLQLQDEAWRRVSAGAEANVDLIALWGESEDHMVAVGGRANARVSDWDGSTWTTVAPSGMGGLSAVHVEPDGRAIVGGVTGYLGTWDGETLTQEGDFLTSVDLHAMWGDDQGTTWAVGGTFLEPHRGVALKRTEP